MIFALLYNLPSQNTRDAQHWATRHKETKRVQNLVTYSAHRLPRASGPRCLHVMSYRKQRITDHANLAGGAKGLVDAIVRAGLLVDDKDVMARITYGQAVLSQMPDALVEQWGRRPLTVITLTDGIPEAGREPRVITEQEARSLGVIP